MIKTYDKDYKVTGEIDPDKIEIALRLDRVSYDTKKEDIVPKRLFKIKMRNKKKFKCYLDDKSILLLTLLDKYREK